MIKTTEIKEVALLSEFKTLHDLVLLDRATMTDALRMALKNLTSDQKNLVISSDVTTCGTSRTARVTLAEFIESAIYNQIIGE